VKYVNAAFPIPSAEDAWLRMPKSGVGGRFDDRSSIAVLNRIGAISITPIGDPVRPVRSDVAGRTRSGEHEGGDDK
jgi:hypothetical protein